MKCMLGWSRFDQASKIWAKYGALNTEQERRKFQYKFVKESNVLNTFVIHEELRKFFQSSRESMQLNQLMMEVIRDNNILWISGHVNNLNSINSLKNFDFKFVLWFNWEYLGGVKQRWRKQVHRHMWSYNSGRRKLFHLVHIHKHLPHCLHLCAQIRHPDNPINNYKTWIYRCRCSQENDSPYSRNGVLMVSPDLPAVS